MWCFVWMVHFTGFEVPYHSLSVLIQQLVVHSYVVIARTVLWNQFSAFFIPLNCLSILVLTSSKRNTNFIDDSRIFGNCFEFGDFIIDVLLVSSENEKCIQVLWISFENIVCHLDCLGFLDSSILIVHSYSNVCVNQIRSLLYDLTIDFEGLFVSGSIVENVGISH
jgi:hypothetical protein